MDYGQIDKLDNSSLRFKATKAVMLLHRDSVESLLEMKGKVLDICQVKNMTDKQRKLLVTFLDKCYEKGVLA